MASTDGQTTDPLIEALTKRAFGFDFYRAVRLLQARRDRGPRVGYSQSLAQDTVRFAQGASLAFAPSTIERVDPGAPGVPPKIWVNFFGLLGPNGPLPLHLTEYARERKLHHGDPTFTAFLNVFHHRLIAFFFRAWADNQKALDLDRADDQRFAIYLGSLFGAGMDSLRHRDAVPDQAKLYYAGRLASQTRSAEGLEAILEDYFGVRTEIQPFTGRWLKLPESSLCQLGASPDTGRLGVNALVGSRFWECQLNFRIQMGPMKLADFERLLPSGRSFERLRCWVRNYTGEEFSWDLRLVLAREEVPRTALGQAGRLGWTTWLKTRPFAQDADDLVVMPPGQ
jgi:type VI secretion system protein ImpH